MGERVSEDWERSWEDGDYCCRGFLGRGSEDVGFFCCDLRRVSEGLGYCCSVFWEGVRGDGGYCFGFFCERVWGDCNDGNLSEVGGFCVGGFVE